MSSFFMFFMFFFILKEKSNFVFFSNKCVKKKKKKLRNPNKIQKFKFIFFYLCLPKFPNKYPAISSNLLFPYPPNTLPNIHIPSDS